MELFKDEEVAGCREKYVTRYNYLFQVSLNRKYVPSVMSIYKSGACSA